MMRCLAFLLLALLFAAPATAQTFPALTGRVVDQANLIPDDREAALTQRLEQLQRVSSRQLVIATVASLEGLEIEDYGYRLGRQWRIGQEGANNGVVLLVAPNERKVRIEVGYGMEGILTDALTSQIVRNDILPRFRDNDYPGGVEAGANALITQLAAPPEAAEQRAIEAERARDAEQGSGGGGGIPINLIIGLLIVGFIVVPAVLDVINPARRSRRRRYGADVLPWGTGLGGGSSWGSGSGSSWSGGGGSSWGGGGGGFSGGGGSFGGGGASGGW